MSKEKFIAGDIFRIRQVPFEYKFIAANGIFSSGSIHRRHLSQTAFVPFYEVDFVLRERILYFIDLFGNKTTDILLFSDMVFLEGAITS